jgi:polygalacturonase
MVNQRLSSCLIHVLLAIFIISFSASSVAQINDRVYNVQDFGALPDTHSISTNSIQAAIDSCYRQGGGTVFFPAGSYISGTIILKDNVVLHLEAEATLYASRNIDDYGAKNIGVKGLGEINGNARRVYEDLRKVDYFIEDITENARNAGVEMKQYYVVPPDVAMFIFYNCQDITMEGVSLVESSFWTLHMIRCQRILIQNMSIYSSLEKGVNADGIDMNSCRDVTIKNCKITTGDDAIVLKTRYDEPCENIRVSNCVLSSSSTALKLGTESFGDFRNIRFETLTVASALWYAMAEQ